MTTNNRIFTKFQRHIDNGNEIIEANDVNKIQSSVSSAEKSIANLQNTTFHEKVLFQFDNNLYVNSLFTDELGDLRNIDIPSSKNIYHNTEEQYITVSNEVSISELYTTKIVSTLGEGFILNDFFLVTDEYKPHGTSIEYYIITDKNEVYPIKANDTKNPCTIHNDVTAITLKAILTNNTLNESPKLYAIAISFFDKGVEEQYGFTYPDISRYEQSSFGTTILIRDRALEDKLVKVIEPNVTTNLNYQNDGRLKIVESIYLKEEVTVEDELNYGNYENSKGEIENLLLSITTTQNKKSEVLE